jgi:hypothetical protein
MRAGQRLRRLPSPRGDGPQLRRPFGLFVRVSNTERNCLAAKLVNATNLALAIALATGIAANWSTIKSMLGSSVIITAITIVIPPGALECGTQ